MSQAALPAADDHALSERIRNGDSAAEEEFARRFRSGLLAIARLRGGGDRADDHVQEAIAAALVNLRRGRWRGEAPLAVYAASILRRVAARDRGRAGAAAGPGEIALDEIPDPGSDLPFEEAARVEARRRLGEALQKLTGAHRQVLELHYFDEKSAEEIARIIGLPRGTVLSRLHYARGQLARLLNRTGRRKD